MANIKVNRIQWIDVAKFIGILLVVLAHTNLYKPLVTFIYTFLMPLFFFISGYLFHKERYPSLSSFIKKRVRQLLIPYINIGLITYLFWLFIGSKVGADAGIEVEWYKPLISSLIGNGKGMVHDIPLWFFLTLFVVECAYYLLSKINKLLLIIVMIIIAFIDHSLSYYFPFSINIAFTAIIFYCLGDIFKEYNEKLFSNSLLKQSLLMCIFLLITIFISLINGRVNMHIKNYHNYLYFLIGGVSGIIFMILFCRIFCSLLYNRFVAYIAKNTLIISGFHLITFTLIKGIMVYVLNIRLSIFNDAIGLNILFSIISLLLCMPIIYIINRFFPFIIGKRRITSP